MMCQVPTKKQKPNTCDIGSQQDIMWDSARTKKLASKREEANPPKDYM